MNKWVLRPLNLSTVSPHSPAVRWGDLLFVSGQVSRDLKTGATLNGDITVQTEHVLENLKTIIELAGGRLENVLKTTCFLSDIGSISEFNAVYLKYFTDERPARSTVEAKLVSGFLVEIEAVVGMPRDGRRRGAYVPDRDDVAGNG